MKPAQQVLREVAYHKDGAFRGQKFVIKAMEAYSKQEIKELKEAVRDFMNEFDYDEEHYKVIRLEKALK